jgi:hypothetical protein
LREINFNYPNFDWICVLNYMRILLLGILLCFSWLELFAQALKSKNPQTFSLGWTGTDLISKSVFLSPFYWTSNVSNAGLNDRIGLDSAGDSLRINWTLGPGTRYKWVQCYLHFSQPISLADFDLFGFDIKGTNIPGEVGFELKFEDGSHQAVVQWERLAGLNRWAERISAAKKQFSNESSLDWSKIRVISLAVYAPAIAANNNSQSGIICITPLKGASMATWERATEQEFIDPQSTIAIGKKAIEALINRQKSTGLLTTWDEDGTSWLYGQGLALKALSLEGNWKQGNPDDKAAMAAEKLALFLSSHQQPEGYWPRAWNSISGSIAVLRENDGTVWMGDFPWVITGLQAYYKKSGDSRVKAAIQNGLNFLVNLIKDDGQFFTKNPQTGTTYEVASCEAYAAAILCLEESGDTVHANALTRYITAYGWDSMLRCWRESTYSDRIVLFANTWMSYYLFQKGETQKALDALSLAGKVLYTRGNGEHYGLDGIVPLSVWYEGTLSYISAGGPGCRNLFNELKSHIHDDGMVSHYNENLGGMGGIWAVDWHSLDGTSWLYFVCKGVSPFKVTEGIPVGIHAAPNLPETDHFSICNGPPGTIWIFPHSQDRQELLLRLFTLDGKEILQQTCTTSGEKIIITPGENKSRIFLVHVISNQEQQVSLIRF